MQRNRSVNPSEDDAEDSSSDVIFHQRAIIERLLVAALHEHDVTRRALEEVGRARFLASASRDLTASLDEAATRAAVGRMALPREESWCIVDVIELDGAVRRLAVAHPDPTAQESAQTAADHWFPPAPATHRAPAGVDVEAIEQMQGADFGELGFGRVLVIPLAVRGSVLGAITFVTRRGDAPFSPEEVTQASNLADLCALALDNARLYREAQSLRELAEAANRAKSAFLGNMSHELMTPLNAIGGYVTLIEMGIRGPVTAEQQVDLLRIRHNQTHLLTLIADLLTFVQSDNGQLEYRFAEVDVQSALREVCLMFQGAADERNLLLLRSPGPEREVVWADPDRVRQILLNLLMNAVKYGSPAGGQITLAWTATFDTVSIHVADDGAGIPRDKLESIFEPFVQLANGLGDRRGGVGLGLPISRDLARAMHGELSVESIVGVGSRFTVTLPRGRRSPTASL